MIAAILMTLVVVPPVEAQTYTGRTTVGGFFDPSEGEIQLLQPARMSTRDVKEGAGLDTISIGEATISIEGVARDPSGVKRVFVNGQPASLADSGAGAFFSSTVAIPGTGEVVEVRAIGRSGNEKVHRFVVRRLYKGQQWAVVIGVSEYQNSDIPRLRFAHEDAIAFYNLLTKPLKEGGAGIPRANTRLLINSEATTVKVREALTDFLKMPTEDDIVYVYYAGHGVHDPDRPVLYFLTYDSDKDFLGSTAIPMEEVGSSLKAYVKARTVLVFVDACHGRGISSGIASRDVFASPKLVNEFLTGLAEARPSTLTFAASDANQLSQEDKRWGGGHGVFTYYLLDALKGAADFNQDGIVRLGEVVQYVSDRVRRETKSQQSPISSGAVDVNLPMTVVPGR
jgi:hypothetical protein